MRLRKERHTRRGQEGSGSRLFAVSLFCCVIIACPGSSAVQQHTQRQIPEAMEQWWYGVNMSTLHHSMEKLPIQRLWTRDDLKIADAAVNFEQLRPLINKLNSGQPINVVAFGDSVVAHYGGCFYSSLDRVVRELPSIQTSVLPAHRYERSWKRLTDTLLDCTSGMKLGWLYSFMHAVNATWPHADHILINNGLSGGTWGELMEMCMENRLPKRTDLIIFEHFPHLERAQLVDLERMLHQLRLFFGGQLPAIIFMNLVRGGNDFGQDPTAKCILGPLSKCAAGDPCVAAFSDRPLQKDIDVPSHGETHALARHYGLTSLSQIDAVAHLARQLEQRGINRCQLLCSLFLDPLHPRELGRLMLADMLTDHLQRAAKWVQPTPAATTKPSIPPLNASSLHVRRMVCYSGTGRGTDNQQIKTLTVVKAEGWAQEQREGRAFWPGWVATTPGAILWIRLDASDVPGQASQQYQTRTSRPKPENALPGAVPMDVRVNVLRSWHHMGKVEVSCLQGCACSTTTFDGHIKDNHWTVPATHDVGDVWLQPTGRRRAMHEAFIAHAGSGRLDRLGERGMLGNFRFGGQGMRRSLQQNNAECILQLRVLPDTSSGGHKVVVSALNMGAWRDLSRDLLG